MTLDPKTSMRRTYMGCRYQASRAGHYESYFVRANHPSKPKAFWIRYTLFSPKNLPRKAIGELWAIYFDGETQRVEALKKELPIAECRYDSDKMSISIGDANLEEGVARGEITEANKQIAWDLSYSGNHQPLLLLGSGLYKSPLPKAKTLVGNPNVLFNGQLQVNGEQVDISDWRGSENHNWGAKHTDSYAWGQVAGFDNAPDAFLEVATARIKLGPVWSPMLTTLVLRYQDQDYSMNSMPQMLKAKAKWDFFDWMFENETDQYKISGRIRADASQFVGLTYRNPPGGSHTCLNTKIAEAEIYLEIFGQPTIRLFTQNKAAFEILTDSANHGVHIVV